MVVELFLKNLDQLMKERRYNMSNIAEALGITQPTVSNWWRRATIPTPQLLEGLCKLFNVTPDYFFRDHDNSLGNSEGKIGDDFTQFIDELAHKNLDKNDLESYHHYGGAKEFLRIMRSNFETDKVGFSNWYFKLAKELGRYATLDLLEKARGLNHRDDHKKSNGQ